MTVATYARSSTKDQSCQIQLDDLRAWSTRQDATVYREYVDHGFSGGKASRPALDELMRDAQLRLFDCVVVAKMDRFGRSVQHLTRALAELDRWGVRFIAIGQGIDTDRSNPTSRLLLHILAAVAEWEKETIRERTTAGVRKAIANGKIVGRPRAIYSRDEVHRLHEAKMPMRKIARHMGVSYGTVRNELRKSAKVSVPVPLV